jgi:hypothetical protein
MPQLLTARVKRPGRRAIRIWVPILPVLILLSPVVLVAVLAAVVACLMYRIDVALAFGTGWRIVTALPGTRFDIEQDRTAVLVTIR